MTEHNPRAFIGGNNPPPYDPIVVEKLNTEAAGFLDAAAEWIEKGDITSEGDAQLLNDFIAGAKKRKTATDKARAAAKKPHDDAGKAVQAAFKPIITKLESAVSKTSPLLTTWLQKKEAARQEKLRIQHEEARRAQEEADRKAAEAAARNDISGEIDAEAAREEADLMAKDAARAAKSKANVTSATGGGRTASLRTYHTAMVVNVRAAFMHYQENPALAECLRSLADAEIRSKDFDPETMKIPGIEIITDRKAV
ncbi:hypothetical protein [Leisingera methylohalidivorans]|uniref:Uncharacterized protein n=1 Tax=Leisingera methylohalidivorans DSM 14336 TaxID=999552 RepID=V9VRY6_9RHOB|nr:hypothetical protein [Leisingera methylohalidivorans]AHD00459.1 hypothetical protein METH_06705 [Leisingera methylohalidivorans DSM 14336]